MKNSKLKDSEIVSLYKGVCALYRFKAGFRLFQAYAISSGHYVPDLDAFTTRVYPVLKEKGLL